MTLRGLIIILLGMSLAFTAYLYADYKRTGGYEENTNGYHGYSFPTTNNLKKVEDCNLAITDFPDDPPPAKEWMDGCKKYFEINK